MAYPTVFFQLPTGTNAASLLDTMFNIVGGMGNIPTTVVGTNALTLTPVATYYQPAAYANYQLVSWRQGATTTGAVTAQLGALAFLNVYMPSGLQAGAGDLPINTHVLAMFAADLNSGAGGWQVLNASTPSVVQPVQGGAKNVIIANGVGSPDTQIAATADEVMLENAAGGTVKVGGGGIGVSVSINTGASGVNGLDSGTMANNTFYSVWVIYNNVTVSGLISLSATSPTLPAGYTYRARLGWVKTGAASTNLHRTLQAGRRTQYVVTAGSQTTSLPVITSSFGTFWTSQTVRGANSFVPVTAGIARVQLQANFSGASGSTQQVGVAPNNAYATVNGTSPYPPMGYLVAPVVNTIAQTINQLGEIVLESNNLFTGAAATTGTVTPVLSAFGWEDNP